MSSITSTQSKKDAGFGQWLKERRNTLGLTREELADKVGCSPETIYKVETGVRRPSRQVAEILAGLFSIPADEREAFISFARGQGSGTGGMSVSGGRPSSGEHPWRASHRRLTNLPAQVTSLIGREGDLKQVCSLLSKDTTRLLTLVGPPGIGKTRLAQEAAAQLLEQFEEGVFFVPLASVTDPNLVTAAIAKALDLKEAANQPLSVQVQRLSAGDEHLQPGAPGQ